MPVIARMYLFPKTTTVSFKKATLMYGSQELPSPASLLKIISASVQTVTLSPKTER